MINYKSRFETDLQRMSHFSHKYACKTKKRLNIPKWNMIY